MPQASEKLRTKMRDYFGGDGVEDFGPIQYLLKKGWARQNGFWTAPRRELSDQEWDCVTFLVEEWDHDFRPPA